MPDDTAQQTGPERKPFRVMLWVVLGVLGLLVLGNVVLMGLDLGLEDRVAIVRIEGAILDSKQTVSDLKEFGRSPSIKAIVLRIDSPGGAVVPSQEIHDAVLRVRNEDQKKVVASMGTVAASGGYYVAVASDRIVANPGTLTGSIGVIMELANLEGLLKKVGVKSVVIKSGRHKDLASPFRELSREDRQILQAVMDDVHDQFIQAVADGRDMEVADVTPLADGRVFTGRQAKVVQLVDEIGNLDDAIDVAADLAGIEGKPTVVEPRRSFSIRELVESYLGGSLPTLQFQPGISLKYMMSL